MNYFLNIFSTNPEWKIIVTAALILVVFVAVWLLLRNIRLWYWKTDKVIDTLNHMNHRINEMEENIDKIKISTEILLDNDVRYLAPLAEKEALDYPVENGVLEHASDESVPDGMSEEEPTVIKPELQRVEDALRELQKQKEQLEADLNARIRL